MQAKVKDLLDPYEDNSNNFDEIKGKFHYFLLLHWFILTVFAKSALTPTKIQNKLKIVVFFLKYFSNLIK